MPPQGRDLTVGSVPRHLVRFAIPMVVGGILQTAYSFVNAIWVGKLLGTTALAAVTVSFPVVFVLVGIGAGVTVATNILISQAYGAKNFPQIRKIVDSGTLLIYLSGLFFCVAGELLAPWILRAMLTPADVFPMALSYLRIFLLSIPFAFGLFLTRNTLQGIGDSKTPLYFQTASLVLAAILDPLVMFGWLGFPKLGLDGTAWVTVLAHFGALAGLVLLLRRRQSMVAPRVRSLIWDRSTAWLIVRIGFPSAVQQSLVSIGMVFTTGLVNHFGETATAALGAASRIEQLAFMPAVIFGMAISTVAGQNIGAEKLDRVKEVFKWGVLISGGVTAFLTVIAVVFPRALLRIFVNDAIVIDQGVTYLHIVAPFYTFFAIMFVSNGIINGSGRTLVTTLISLISLWVVRMPFAYWLSRHLDSVNGVWIAVSVSCFVAMFVSLGYYSTGRWKKKLVRETPTPEIPSEIPLESQATPAPTSV